MNLQVIKIRVLFWLKRIVLYGLYTILFLIISSFFILQIPSVQSSLAKRILRSFSAVSGFTTTLDQVQFYWFDRLIITGLRVEDPEQNTMIGVDRLMVNFRFSGLFQEKGINLDATTLEGATVYFKTINDADTARDLNINVFIARINAMSKAEGGTGTTLITIGEAILKNCHFALSNDADTLHHQFDPNHFAFTIPEAELQNFMVLNDTIEFNMRSLSATEDKLNFPIHQLSTFFRISQQGMEFLGLDLQAGETRFSDTLIFRYSSQAAFSSFIDSVTVHARFSNSIIHPKDLSLFVPLPEGLVNPIELSGEFDGRINRFRFQKMDIKTGGTQLQGALEMDGLPIINETFILLSLNRSQIDFSDLAFLLDDEIMARLEPLGTLNFRGQFLGYPTDFVAAGDFSSSIGRITSDINLKINETSVDLTEYNGQLKLTNFDLGQYLNDTTNFQKVTVSGKINGKGLTLAAADFTLDGTINSIGLRGYNYTNISTNARFASQFFSGKISIDDPNLEFEAEGSVDLRNMMNKISLSGSLHHAYLNNLKLTTEKIYLQTKLDVDIQGLVLDSLTGSAQLNQLFIVYEDDSVHLSSVLLTAEQKEHHRLLKLETSLFDAQAEGDFYFTNLFRDVPVIINEFRLNIVNDSIAIREYYDKKSRVPERYFADFNATIKDFTPISDVFDLDVSVSRDTRIQGKYTSGASTNLQVYSAIDSVRLGTAYFFQSELEVNASKTYDSTSALAMVYLFSKTQELSGIKTKNLITEVIWDRSRMNVDLSISQQETTNRFDLATRIDFEDSTYIKLLPSTIRVLDDNWSVNPENSIAVKGSEWNIKHVGFFQRDQFIDLNGFLSQDSTRELSLTIKDFKLANINPLIARKLDGLLNAELVVNNFYRSRSLQNTMLISDLEVNDFLIGTITGNNLWSAAAQRFNVEFFIDRLENRIVNCGGYYAPGHATSPLNITAQFNKANLKIFEPFLDDLFSEFQGTLTGDYSVTGTLTEPLLNGEGSIENGAMQINYLKTMYQFTGILGLKPDAIYFKDMELTDTFRNRGSLSGSIFHKRFSNMSISLDGQFTDFQVLNTTSRDNSLFYGQAYASGSVRISGPLDNLVIAATATTRRNTRIYIPISGSTTVEQKDYINFVSFRDSTYIASQDSEVSKKISLTGVTIDFNIDVTPDAYCEIIFDLKAGDIIRGRGNGKIKLQLDTKGEFNMFGPIEFTEGWYNFTLYDIINKEFQIQPGSSIAWYGDPYLGTMNINATYNQLASLSPIIADQSLANVPQIKRKYPVQVLLKLEGPMLAPAINFDIVARDLPKSVAVEGRPPVSLDIEFIAFKNRLDEQELKRQVFSLIILRRFSPPESFNTSGSLVNSVSELFSNQLSYWLSQVDENFEIDVDLGSMDQEAFNAFQLRMSYTFMNGRLRITRDGTVGNQAPVAGSTESNRNELATAIGDWTVDYILSADGKFRVKMYSRTNTNPMVNTFNSQNAFTTGVSLMYTQSFNELKDLLGKSRDKNRRSVPLDEELNEEGLKEENDGSD
jgi:hypothetical protein